MAVMLPMGASAQNTSLLNRLYDTFASDCVILDCTYTISASGITSKGECQVQIQGTAYIMSGSGLEIFCDGETVWILDSAAKEAVIEPVSDDAMSYMTNPALLFKDMDKVFTMAGSFQTSEGTRYQLKANDACGIKNAVLHIGNDAALRDAEFTLDDDSVIKIQVSSEKVSALKPIENFRPASFSSEWIVTDFRDF